MGAGKVGYLALEGADANPNLSDLVTATYRRIAEQPELAHLLHDIDREVVVPVPLRGVRRDLGLREVADAAAELLVLAAQLETAHGGIVARLVSER